MNDSIGLYLNDIGKVPLLTAEDERVLSRKIEEGREAAELLAAGNVKGRRRADLKAKEAAAADAKDRFIRSNLRLELGCQHPRQQSSLALNPMSSR